MASPRRWISPFARIPKELEEVLRRGGVVIYPTETVYGLGGDPQHAAVIERIQNLKGRPVHKPFPLIVADREAVRHWVQWHRDPLDRIAERFWPGPLTLVLQAASNVPQGLQSAEGTVAVRVSAHPVATLMAKACGGALVATSANLSGEPPVSSPAELSRALLDAVDGLVDGGTLPPSPPSTLVAVTFHEEGFSWKVLRQGAVSAETLALFFQGENVAATMEDL
ncbi:translation factor SUA5 [Desulfosoma caldarium]|uniref:L-threonylcarbamoyladenylate synthase n=2 Tax=Desulfosoma caldarium TaxID=610254 RepID=A0A3N1UQN6_9BACT|nr:translation factor SUA5 [Desulfosoma caldarium]